MNYVLHEGTETGKCHEIPKIIKNLKKIKKKNKTQHATGEDAKSKTTIFLQIPLFFYTLSNSNSKEERGQFMGLSFLLSITHYWGRGSVWEH